MKNAIIIALAALLFVRCGEESLQESNSENTETTAIGSDAAFNISEEMLESYALTALDSVYSVVVKLSARDSSVINYKATLQQGETIYEDSLIVSVPANETVQAQLIFSACRVKNQPIPQLTSKATALGN